jgi:hypothetical protein
VFYVLLINIALLLAALQLLMFFQRTLTYLETKLFLLNKLFHPIRSYLIYLEAVPIRNLRALLEATRFHLNEDCRRSR